MNGEPLPLKHGYPLRALALGWTGANCVKWLAKIMALKRSFEGFFMDQAYRIYQKSQEPQTGEVVTGLNLKSIIAHPVAGDRLPAGIITVLGAAYGGEKDIESVEVSVDNGKTWSTVELIGPHELFA
jgi:hypothetical protein